MKLLNRWIRRNLGFSRMEANGLVVLIPLMMLIVSSPYIYSHVVKKELPAPVITDYELATKEKPRLETRDLERPEYVRPKKTFQRQPSKAIIAKERPARRYRAIEPFDINAADTAVLKQVYGIGPKLSNRIVRYRELIGGYVSLDQLHEVYGLQDSVLAALDTLSFVAQAFQPEAIPINDLNEKDLARHPYVSQAQARAIKSYQYQHGAFESVQDLSKIHIMDSLSIARIAPYLKF